MDTKTSFAQGQLRSLIERIERLEEEKKAIAGDIKEVYGEAKANGFDVKIMRKVVTLRKKEAADRAEEEAILDLYMSALGMIVSEDSAAAE
ncbi:MAG: GapR family DNA-binding domain-containing protein [Anderseniella sp.]